jgi:hypothetical protein
MTARPALSNRRNLLVPWTRGCPSGLLSRSCHPLGEQPVHPVRRKARPPLRPGNQEVIPFRGLRVSLISMRCPIGIYATPSSLATVGRKAYRFRQADFLIFKSIPAPISLATWFLKFSRSRNPVALPLSRNCGSLIIKLVVMLHRHLTIRDLP